MNTILITCAKNQAQVTDEDGRFLNRVSNGVLVEAGDLVSVEQIAINSVGIGGEIQEIPRELKNYPYYTNELLLKAAFYIHHNYEFSIQLPIIEAKDDGITLETAWDITQPYIAGGGGVPVFQPDYGYMIGSATYTRPTSNFQLLKTTISKINAGNTAGKRFWIITPEANTFATTPPDPPEGIPGYPTLATYKLFDTTIPLSVDVGYDSPSNIAGKLTEDLHSTLLHPLQTPLNLNIQADDAPYESINNNFTNKDLASISSNDGTIAVLKANFTRPTPIIGGNGGTTQATPIYECIAALNPYLWIYGSRLLQGLGTVKFDPSTGQVGSGMGWKNNKIIENQVGALLPDYTKDTYSVMNLYDLPKVTDGAGVQYNTFTEGYILITNLCWTTPNVQNLSKLIKSQMNYTGNGTTTAKMVDSQNKQDWIYRLPFGRVLDSSSYITPDLVQPLKPLLQAAATTACGGYDATLRDINNPKINVSGFYSNVIYNKAYMGAQDIADGCEFVNAREIDAVYNDDYTLQLDPKTAAKYYDVNIIPIRNNKENKIYNEEVYIGIICNDHQVGAAAPNPPPLIIEKANYCIVDLGAKNLQNPIVAIMNPNLKADEGTGVVPAFSTPTTQAASYVNTIQVGTPNSSLQFDSGRGRFNFQELHWDRYEGNTRGSSTGDQPDANLGADVIVNTFNKTTDNTFDSMVGGQTIDTITLVNANSGIGLIDVGLSKKDGFIGSYDFLSNFRNEEKQAFWSECLLSRLGFDYKALFNPYGLPDSWFLTRTYETKTNSKLVQYFPYPLTTNSILDSTLAFDFDQSNTVTPRPMYQLSSQQGRWNLNASTSTASIFASNLPQKLVYPFWLIYSDIIGGITFHSSNSGAESNIIAICNRSYVSGDFAYSFATDYVFTATKDFVITGVTTQILNPDLTPADIDDRTTIIYKVQKPLKMLQAEEPPPNETKEKLKQRTGR
jgi:hypothetical protein